MGKGAALEDISPAAPGGVAQPGRGGDAGRPFPIQGKGGGSGGYIPRRAGRGGTAGAGRQGQAAAGGGRSAP